MNKKQVITSLTVIVVMLLFTLILTEYLPFIILKRGSLTIFTLWFIGLMSAILAMYTYKKLETKPEVEFDY
jgi:hypothetical protein